MKVTKKKLADLRRPERNVRRHTEKQIREFRRSVEMFADMPRYFNTPNKLRVAKQYKGLFLRVSVFATNKDYRRMYEALQKGDPKLRTYRAIYQTIFGEYIERAKAEQKGVNA